MTPEQIWNLVLLSVQAIILFGQLLLSRKINNQTISREKGYFLIEKTNVFVAKEDENRFRDQFDLSSDRGIGFHAIKGDIILKGSTYSIDGVTYQNGKPINVFYTEDNRFNKLVVLLDLKDFHLKKEYLDIEFMFNLENTAGYKYREIVDIRFMKMDNDSWYRISKYNMSFNK